MRWFVGLILFVVGLGLGLKFETLKTIGSKVADRLAFYEENEVGVTDFLKDNSLDDLHLVIEDSQMEKLEKVRKKAIKKGILLQKKYVKASILYKGDTVQAKVRLKGDNLDHLMDGMWSFRVKTDKDEPTIEGCRKFSLQHPRTRNFIYEWVMHQMLKKEQIVSLRYNYINYHLNGEFVGVFAMEEHFDKLLLENNQRKEGPIVKFSEDASWEEEMQQLRPFLGSEMNNSEFPLNSHIVAYGKLKKEDNPVLFDLRTNAVASLHAFRNREQPASETFDVEKMSTYLAIMDLLSAVHGTRWHNMRFFFNPLTGLLEPIGFDGNPGGAMVTDKLSIHTAFSESDWGYANEAYFKLLFEDPVLVEAYLKKLEVFSSESFLQETHAELDSSISELNKTMATEYAVGFSWDVINQNAAYIKSVLNSVKPICAYGILNDSKDSVTVVVANNHIIPLSALSVKVDSVEFELDSSASFLGPRKKMSPLNFSRFTIALGESSGTPLKKMKLRYQQLGRDGTQKVQLSEWQYEGIGGAEMRVQNASESAFPFIQPDPVNGGLMVLPGSWKIDSDLVIPAGTQLNVSGPVDLDLANGAGVVSYSPVQLVGTVESPIVIHSTDGTGMGFSVISAPERSTLDHVVFENLTNPQNKGLSLSGAVSFYDSPVDISNSHFIDAQCEDALNVIRTEFTLVNSVISGSFSDALDSDFCSGQIYLCEFNNIGNDAIDVSGSEISINGLVVNGANDKAISVGENSNMTGENIKISRAAFGIVSKDLSVGHFSNVEIDTVESSFLVFQKKPEFGPGTLVIETIDKSALTKNPMIEHGSFLTVNGVLQESNHQDIKEEIY